MFKYYGQPTDGQLPWFRFFTAKIAATRPCSDKYMNYSAI